MVDILDPSESCTLVNSQSLSVQAFETFKIGDQSEMYPDGVDFMTLWEHLTTDVEIGERLHLGEVVVEVTDIAAGVITVKSDRDYTFQENERIKIARGGFDYQPYLLGDINKAFKFLGSTAYLEVDYLAVPVEYVSEV